jgi:hypothetical protein
MRCEQVDAAQQCTFAGAAGADDHDRLPLVDLEIYVLEDDIFAVDLGQVASL